MIYKSRGIVLRSTKYSDSGLIVKIYTESFGLQTYLIHSARSKKSKMKIGIFQPVTILDFVASHNKKQGLQFIKEITGCEQFTGIPYNIKKSSIAIFMAEVLYKAVHEEEQNKPLFDFIHTSLQTLDKMTGRVSEFHLIFLIELTKHLGFHPHLNYDDKNRIFDLYEGCFHEHLPEHSYFIEKDLSKHFYNLIAASSNKIKMNPLSAIIRKELLNKILDYYRIHLNGFSIVRSYAVMEDVFN